MDRSALQLHSHNAEVGLRPDPRELIEETPPSINLTSLKKLTNASIVSAKQFDKELVVSVCHFAAMLESTEVASFHPLDGLIAITAFFEASTRTRLSFESATLRLDGKILSVPDGKVTGVAKGESIQDIGEMFNAYGDIVIMRHTETDSVDHILNSLRIPLINAGNGTGEHPTQALADWFALLKWKPKLAEDKLNSEDKINLGIVGTPASMRAERSFVILSLLFKEAINHITFISEMADPLGEDLGDLVKNSGISCSTVNDLSEVVEDLDVVYINSITHLGDSYKALGQRYKVNLSTKLKEDAVVLHPLARQDELSTKIDDTEHNLYFSQAAGAVYVRQALLISVLGRFDRLPQSINPASAGISRK